MAVLGITARWSYVDVGPDEIDVRMSWAFRATFERSSIESVSDDHDRVLGWGAHGWRGQWLVNGSSSGIVRVVLDTESRARVVGIPVRLRVLRIALVDPEGFRIAIAG